MAALTASMSGGHDGCRGCSSHGYDDPRDPREDYHCNHIAVIQRRSEVKLNAIPWFHGKITREGAEDLLQPREVRND